MHPRQRNSEGKVQQDVLHSFALGISFSLAHLFTEVPIKKEKEIKGKGQDTLFQILWHVWLKTI